jgi:TRAP-type C4-dicarboxylate transport system permease small subunit
MSLFPESEVGRGRAASSELPRGILAIDRFLSWMETLFIWASCLCLTIMLVTNVANIAVRNLTGRGIVWVWPWTGTLMIWMVFLAFYVLYRRRLDITVEYFIDRMSPKWRRATRIGVDLCGVLMMAIILIEAPQIIERQVGVMDFIGLDRYALSIPLIASSLLIAIEMALDALKIALTPIVPPPSTEAELPRWSL